MKLVLLAYVYWAGYPQAKRNSGYMCTSRVQQDSPVFSSVRRLDHPSPVLGYLATRNRDNGAGRKGYIWTER